LDSPSKSANATSPLKPLPFHSIPLQDSVLGPSWKPLWSPELGLSMSSTKPTRNEPQSSSTCKTSQDQTAATDKKDPDPVAPIHSGDPDVDTHAANPISTTSDTVSVSPSYLCEWESCSASFEDKSQVSSHVYLTHLATKLADSSSQSSAYIHPALPVRRCCRWRGCSSSSLARAPFALLTHVLDVHCSPMELDAALYRSQSRAQPRLMPVSASSTSSSSAPPSSSSSLSDLQNLCSTVHADMSSSPSGDSSAWTIVRSLEAKQMQLDLWAAQHHFVSANPYSRLPLPILGPNPHHPQTPMVAPPPREGPVTKHLRVSAALVIRNLVTYIEEARTPIPDFEGITDPSYRHPSRDPPCLM
uniref:C2H2-type domain-containing protein n=1 Tax=Echinostoma caproni TaxID=27848 RepID=A0A183BCF9_9TREM